MRGVLDKGTAIGVLIGEGFLKTPKVIKIFRDIPRENFVPEEYKEYAYSDTPLDIGHGQTISQLLIVAHTIENLDVKDGQKILEIGSGLGYQAALLSALNPNGKIYTVEIVPDLAKKAKENLKEYKNVTVIYGDASKGLSKYAPFDRIVAACGCREIPKKWFEELKDDGKLVAPVGKKFLQRLALYEKKKGKITTQDLNMPCAFVPLRIQKGGEVDDQESNLVFGRFR